MNGTSQIKWCNFLLCFRKTPTGSIMSPVVWIVIAINTLCGMNKLQGEVIFFANGRSSDFKFAGVN